jgi:hypothetical protein
MLRLGGTRVGFPPLDLYYDIENRFLRYGKLVMAVSYGSRLDAPHIAPSGQSSLGLQASCGAYDVICYP